jgi:hypothetical protein
VRSRMGSHMSSVVKVLLFTFSLKYFGSRKNVIDPTFLCNSIKVVFFGGLLLLFLFSDDDEEPLSERLVK